MWIFSKVGFVSVVQVRGKPGRLMVRGRRLEDVEHWAALCNTRSPRRVIHTPRADYPWRFTTSRSRVISAVVLAIARLDYDNFKDAAHKEDGDRARALAYMKVWSAMREFGDSR